MTAAATAAAGDQNTTAQNDVADDTTEENAAADQGDDTTGDADESEVNWEAKAKELEASLEAQKRVNRNLDRRTKRDMLRLDELEGTKQAPTKDKPPDAQPPGAVDVEKIRAEAVEQAKKEAQQEALKERVLDKIEARAAKGFADPADAVAQLMYGRIVDEFIADGKVDAEAIQDALTEPLEKKPYLGAAAQGGQNRFQGSAEGGAKPHKPQRPQSLHEAVNRRYNTPQ